MGDSLMDTFCGSEFWDANKTWYTDTPVFTSCFEKTVLVWTPCAFLWALVPLETTYILSSKGRYIPWSWYNIVKTILVCLLVLLSVVDLGHYLSHYEFNYKVSLVDIVATLVKTITFILAAGLLEWNRRCGVRTSSILSMFWILLVILSSPRLVSVIHIHLNSQSGASPSYLFVSYVLYYVIIVIMALFSSMATDSPPLHSKYPKIEKPCPYLAAPFLSRLCHFWFDRFMWGGFRTTLVEDDLWCLNPWDSAKQKVPKFQKQWTNINFKSKRSSYPYASFQRNSTRVNFTMGKKKSNPKLLLIYTIIRTFWPTLLFGSSLGILADLLTFVNPQILSYLIAFVQGDEHIWKGYMYVVTMFVCTVSLSVIHSHQMLTMSFLGLRIRSTIISVIYRKALQISSMSRKDSTVGEIVNLMAVDAQRLMDICGHICMIWSAPLQILLCLYFLYDILGISIFAGVAVMVLMVPINSYIANRVKSLQFVQMKTKDVRIKVMNEILNGIRVLKLYAWEPSFEKQIVTTREKEINTLKKASYYHTALACMWTCTPFLVSCVSFATYILIDENNVLDVQKAFVSLTLFNLLRMPLTFIPILVAIIVQTNVAVQRIADFLTQEDLNLDNVTHDEKSNFPLVIENGTFSWGKDAEPVLRDITMKVTNGSLIAVVGTVGSGKSSLLSAFLGEMEKISGTVTMKGSLAYVSQQAWIQNATLKNNILFGKPYDHKLYHQVVDACALLPDIKIMPAGDETEIGEKGINLSGGQKQRVSLARALYNDLDVYFFDDPLSAVDSHVGKHIFEKVIGPTGMLKYKTRILVTHSITFLPDTKQIIVLKDGKISESGTYKELIKQKGAFAEFLDQHLQDVVAGDALSDTTLEDIRLQLESTLGTEEFRRKLDRAISRVSEKLSETESVGKSVDSVHVIRRTSVESMKSNGSLRNLNGSLSQINGSATKLNNLNKKSTEPQGKRLIEAEQVEVGNVKWVVFKYYFKAIGLFFSAGALLSNLFFQVFQVGSNLWLAAWSENTYGTNGTTPQDLYIGVYGLLGVIQVFGVSLSVLAVSIGSFNAAKLLHNRMLSNIVHLPQSLFDTTPVGRILTRFSSDVNVLDTTFPMILRMVLMHIFRVFATLIIISISTPIFMIIIVPIVIIYYCIQRIYVANSRQLKRMESASRAPIYSHFGETLQGASVIRAYNAQERFIDESDTRVDFSQKCYTPGIFGQSWLAVRLEFIGALILFFSALFSVLSRDTASAAFVGLSISYALQITGTLNMLVRHLSDFETNFVAVERIKEYTEYKQEAAWDNPNHRVPDNWPHHGEVKFCNYELRYRDGLDLVLKGITFTVNGGEKVGIVGRTGAGKSSLALGLFRIIEPAGGSIIIDDIDITKLGLHTVRSRLTIIPQDPVLFSGTLRLNLDPFDNMSDKSLWKTLELAHLKTFVESLPAGLNHPISEGGENLSVGQRQLVCLARALLRKSKILVLDEATAAVDLETDDLIQETIRTEFKECTILTIAHRLNTILDYDRVVVLDKGDVIEYDSPQSLLQKRTSVFYGMAKDAGLI